MASARVRRTFRYPESDSEDGATNQELDEQEQESVISDLRRQNEKQNAQYKRILTILPIPCSLVFLPYIFSSTISALHRFLSILSVVSLISTAYATRAFPMVHPEGESNRLPRRLRLENNTTKFYLNMFSTAAFAILVLAAYLLRHSIESGSLPYLLWIPAVVFVTVRLAERAMISVDVDELVKLRYEYKGA